MTSEPPPTRATGTIRRLGPIGLLGLLWTAAPALAGIYLLAKIGPVSDWLLTHRGVGLLIYTGVFIAAAGFGLLPTYAQSILGGWVFGLTLGLPAALVGFTGAALLGYFIARTVSRDRAERVIEEHPKAEAIKQTLIGHGFWKTLLVVGLIRVPPNSPFALTNLAMAATGVPLIPFAVGTLLGMAPRTAVAVGLAAAAKDSGARDIQEFASRPFGTWFLIGGVVLLLVVVAIIGAMGNRALERLNTSRRT